MNRAEVRHAQVTSPEKQPREQVQMPGVRNHRIFTFALLQIGDAEAAEEMSACALARAGCSQPYDAVLRAFLLELRDTLGPFQLELPTIFLRSATRMRNITAAEWTELLRDLPAAERLLYLLRYAECREPGDIAAMLGVTPAQVAVGATMALLRLRTIASDRAIGR